MTSDRCEASWELLFLLKEAVTKEKKRFLTDLPVLDQGDDLGVGLPNDALSIHLHYPIPCRFKVRRTR